MLEVFTGVVSNATLTDWGLLLVGVVTCLYIFGTWNYDFFTRKGIPSTRPSVPFLGDTYKAFMVLEPFQNLVLDLYNSGKGHSVFGIFEFRRPIFMLRDPELIKMIGVKDFDHFPNHRESVNEKSDPIFAKNLFALRDQRWRDMRATLSPAFTTSKMKNMFPLISQCGEQMAQHLLEEHKRGGGKPLSTNMKDIFSRIANDVIATAAFGVGCDSLKEPKNEFFKMGKDITQFTVLRSLIFTISLIFPAFMKLVKVSVLSPKATKFFDGLVHETIKEREKKNIFRPDVLQLLMQARAGELKTEASDADEDEKIKAEKTKLTDEDITAQAVIFFFAGFETVSTALSFASYALSLHPEAQTRLHKEVDEVMKQTNGKLTYEAIQSMKYLDMVINETLRLYPPVVAMDRQCREDTTVAATDKSPAFTVKAGQVMWIPTTGIHYDPEYWPNPEKFDPERFSDENKQNIKPFTYVPFGIGPRLCVGQRFALLEVKIALVHLMANFELRKSPKLKLPLEYEKGFNVMIKGGFWCDLVPRKV